MVPTTRPANENSLQATQQPLINQGREGGEEISRPKEQIALSRPSWGTADNSPELCEVLPKRSRGGSGCATKRELRRKIASRMYFGSPRQWPKSRPIRSDLACAVARASLSESRPFQGCLRCLLIAFGTRFQARLLSSALGLVQHARPQSCCTHETARLQVVSLGRSVQCCNCARSPSR